MEPHELKYYLRQMFYGTENYYKHMNVLLTDGAKFLAEEGKCFWLMDVVASYQAELLKKGCEFQLWNIKVDKDKKATITCREDSGVPPVVTQVVEYTDFPLDEYEFYGIYDYFYKKTVVMLKGEY